MSTSPIETVLHLLEGHKVRRSGHDQWRACCPGHGGSNASALSVSIGENDSVLVKCWTGCTADAVALGLGLTLADLFPQVHRVESRPAGPPSRTARVVSAWHADEEAAVARKRSRAACLWRESRQITPDVPAGQYLRLSRGCALPPPDSDLRWLPDLRLFGFSGPALVGRMSLATDRRKGCGLHCTWIAPDGNAGWRRAERRYLGPKSGAVVRLWPDDCITLGLAVAEGIETALSLAHDYQPTWAAMDAGNLGGLPLLPGIETLVIGADHDPAGISAATECADRWAACGIEVHVIAPASAKSDWNDARCAA